MTKKKEVQEEKPKPRLIKATLSALTQVVSFTKVTKKTEGREEDGNPGNPTD